MANDDVFMKRLQAAVRAGWCTIIIFAIVLTFQFVLYRIVVATEWRFIAWIWGVEFAWMKAIWIDAMVKFKIVAFPLVLAVIFLTLWQKQLKRS